MMRNMWQRKKQKKVRRGNISLVMDYEKFKAAVFKMTGIDLSAYKEAQMKRRINTLITKHKINGYEDFVSALKSDKKLFEEFVNYLTINVSEFYRNPDQWDLMDKIFIPELISKFGKNLKKLRSIMAEGAFGVLKEDRGFTRFSRRGLDNAKMEFLLVCLGFNLRKYHHWYRKKCKEKVKSLSN